MAAEGSLENRRTAYRVRPESIHELDLAVLEKRYRLVRGKVADVAIGGVQVQFDKDALAPVDAGDRIQLALASERYDFDRTVWARIVASIEDDREKTLSVSFEDDDGSITSNDEQLFELFNRRAKYRRVEDGAGNALAVRAAPGHAGADTLTDYPVTIRDISSVGICFAVDAVADAALRAHDDLLLHLFLPKHKAAQSVPCQVRRRSTHGGDIYYGCEFDWSASASALALIEELVAYVEAHLESDARMAERLAGEHKRRSEA
jgi:hypothetical protein